MVFFYLTNVALDVSMGVAWWITKTTFIQLYNGTKYIIYGPDGNPIEKEESTNKQILEELQKLKKELKELKSTSKK